MCLCTSMCVCGKEGFGIQGPPFPDMHWPFQPDRDKGTRREGWGHEGSGVCVHVCLFACVLMATSVSVCLCVDIVSLRNHLVCPKLLHWPCGTDLHQWYTSHPTSLSLSSHPSLLSSFVGFDIALSRQSSVCKKAGPLRARQLWTLSNQFVCGRGKGKGSCGEILQHWGWHRDMQISFLKQCHSLLFFALFLAYEESLNKPNQQRCNFVSSQFQHHENENKYGQFWVALNVHSI